VPSETAHPGARDHLAVFYQGEPDLADRVGGFLSAGLTAGDVTVIVATPQHERLLTTWLERAGVQVSDAQREGRYQVLDAMQTMARFMLAGWPDAAGFWQVIGDVIRAAEAHGRRVRIYGEMVALLWQAGLSAAAAIELEALWNELAAQYVFSLACGYPVAAVSGDEQSDALAQICDTHTAILGNPAMRS
jgi:hypothetical protein